jgi:orotate phosphoribosyltransferase
MSGMDEKTVGRTAGHAVQGDADRDELRAIVAKAVGPKPFSELYDVSLDQRGAALSGRALLDALEQAERSGRVAHVDAVGALTAAAVPLAVAMMDAAGQKGRALDAFCLDFVFPSTKGPAVAGRNVLLLDAWLSERSYIQTSSIVTLHRGNELGLDFGILRAKSATPVAIAALVGGTGALTGERSGQIRVINPTDGSAQDLPFLRVFEVGQVSTFASPSLEKTDRC